MTAHALTGDREKSLDAGMNDHLTKPIDRDSLGTALRQWLPREKCPALTTDEPDLASNRGRLSIPPLPGLDMKAGLNRLNGNLELYLKLLRDFVAGYGETSSQLLQELRTDRREVVLQRVHAIRGIAGNLGGKELEAAAAELEKACRAAENGVPFALGKPLRTFIDCHEALIMSIGAVLVRQPVVSPLKPEGQPGDAAEMRLLLERLKKALLSEEPQPCKGIMETLLQRRWPEGHEAVLVDMNRLVQHYRLADALALLDKEFKDDMGNGDGAEGIP
jgi:HPt (histidine-containing phosphotransfer) domain-containing protein